MRDGRDAVYCCRVFSRDSQGGRLERGERDHMVKGGWVLDGGGGDRDDVTVDSRGDK